MTLIGDLALLYVTRLSLSGLTGLAWTNPLIE